MNPDSVKVSPFSPTIGACPAQRGKLWWNNGREVEEDMLCQVEKPV